MSVSSIQSKTNETALCPLWQLHISGQIIINGQVMQAKVLVPALFKAIYVLQTEVLKVEKQLKSVQEEKKIALHALKIKSDELRQTHWELAHAKLSQGSLQQELATVTTEVERTALKLQRLAEEWRRKTLLIGGILEQALR